MVLVAYLPTHLRRCCEKRLRLLFRRARLRLYGSHTAVFVCPTVLPVAPPQQQVAGDLREHMEIVHTSEYSSFINNLLRCFVELLQNRLPPQVKTRWLLLQWYL